METKAIDGMCRCCASSGIFKDLYTTFNWMGEDEIYANMLQYCFDITLSTADDQNNGGICEVCITQLRNAANFKKQVQNTEIQFKRLLEEKDFNTKAVKIEISEMTDLIDDVINTDNEMSDSDGEFTLNIKQESPEPKAKKRTKATSSRATDDDIGETSTKRRLRTLRKIKSESTEKNIDKSKGRELMKHRNNIREILKCSNATPIRCHVGIGYACVFCEKQYPNPKDLKKHTIEEHASKTKRFMEGKQMFSYIVKLDITSLQCNLCATNINTLEVLIDHLINVHKRKFYTDIKNHILPFKFDDDAILKCVYCVSLFNKFKALLEHMNIHYRNYICDVCDVGFVNRSMLLNHSEAHKKGTFKCDYCDKVYDTQRKKKSHEKSVHIHLNMLNRCGYCKEKFNTYGRKLDHLVKVHGVQSPVLKCKACDKQFETQKSLTIHVKRDHLLERKHECKICDMKFFVTHQLQQHMIKHTGLASFVCEFCHKAYKRRKTLKEHLRIHADDRRFKCEHCGQAFVQKCSWRGHMRAKHGEAV
ncbi:PREDICTED: zinc finger protein 675-like isoform X5 [Papilio polytes]|uniref:zinc finger protein 675-like isoform X5 n=1 Tax=Papilio polytes TaxID=76194 RepID=UPI0006768F11|nr:PREDICTED: zinc finger protein 675-like isoform X5 [Papilio polytes]